MTEKKTTVDTIVNVSTDEIIEEAVNNSQLSSYGYSTVEKALLLTKEALRLQKASLEERFRERLREQAEQIKTELEAAMIEQEVDEDGEVFTYKTLVYEGEFEEIMKKYTNNEVVGQGTDEVCDDCGGAE